MKCFEECELISRNFVKRPINLLITSVHFQAETSKNYLEMSFFKSVTVPEPFLKTVMSAEVSRRLRIFDMKSGSTGGGPPEIEEAVKSEYF